MTKSKGIGRGGRRSNPGGRPPKQKQTALPQPTAIGDDLTGQTELSSEELLAKAKRTLSAVMDDGKATASAKVSAAKVIVAIAAPKAVASPTGKKGQQAEAAKAAGAHRFATPAPPRLVVDNK